MNWIVAAVGRQRLICGALLATLYLACLVLGPAGTLATLPMAAPFLPPSLAHPLGTDDLGRDLLAAVAQGGRTSLSVAALATALSVGLGTFAGLVAGLGPRLADELAMRLGDIVLSLPALLFALLVASLFGGSALNLAFVLGLSRWPVVARLVRSETQALRHSDFVRGAVAVGTPPLRLATRHILPHVASAALPATGILFGGAVLAESALAFVGLGDPRLTSWGHLIAAGYAFLGHGWWMWAFPTLALCITSALVALAAEPGVRPN